MPEWPALPARLMLLACRGLQKPERILQTPLNMLCPSRDHSEETTSDEEDEAEDEAEDEKKEEDKEKMTTKKLVTKAVLMLLAGTIVCAVFSDPMVDAVSNFSKVSRLQSRVSIGLHGGSGAAGRPVMHTITQKTEGSCPACAVISPLTQ